MRRSQLRFIAAGIGIVVLLGVLVVQLFYLQFVKGEHYLQKELEFSRKVTRMTGPRGKILDANGLPLAYNQTSYSVQFMRDPSLSGLKNRTKYTKSIRRTIEIVERNGGKTLSTFAIHRMEDGAFQFFWPGFDHVANPKTYQARIKRWKGNMCNKLRKIYSDHTPEEIYNECRVYYGIPESVTYDEAFKILSVWQEVQATFYQSFIPVTIANNVDMNTVAEIEIRRNELVGMQISQSNSRVYPNKAMAAHIVGYMGSMFEESTIKEMETLGYRSDDLVGVYGVEASEELELSGNTNDRSGTRVVEVDNLGKVVREITNDHKDPKPGNNVMLTMDSKFQKVLEEALKENIAICRADQESAYLAKKDEFDLSVVDRGGRPIQWASVGAAVVMECQTGRILAMASYPSFDPNLFTGGLSQADFEKYFGAGTNNPLFNNAISSRGTPGSIFKMCTGIAALMEGQLSLDEEIDDEGPYIAHMGTSVERAPSCWVRPYFGQHQDQTIVDGLQNSCNYFFFTVADRLGIDRLSNWADILGLTSKTNVELSSEIAGQMSNQESLYSKDHMSGVAALVRNQIVGLMKEACDGIGLQYEDGMYTETALELMDIVNQGTKNMGPDIRAILQNEMKMKPADIRKYNLDNEISMLLAQIRWDLNPNFTIEAGIGQSVTLLTPVGVARYVSTLVNGGNVYEARLVKSIITPEGSVRDVAPKLVRNIGAKPEFLNAIMQGMNQVVSGEEGTAADYFADCKYKDLIGGKTGTAQVNQTMELENNSWFVAFAPYQADEENPTAEPKVKPEIVVAVYIPNGFKGALSSYTVKEVIEYYLDSKDLSHEQQDMPLANTIVK